MAMKTEFEIMNEVRNKLSEMIDIKELMNIEKLYSDGRTASTVQESYIIDKLKLLNEYEWFVPPPRWWFDIALLHDSTYIPINIKITTMTTSDNIGNYSILAYSMTGKEMSHDCNYSNSVLDEFISGDIKFEEVKRDYWFLVVNKQDKNERVYVNSFKGLKRLTANKLNLPFQIKWINNLEYNLKTTNEMFNLIREATRNYAEAKTPLQKHVEIFEL